MPDLSGEHGLRISELTARYGDAVALWSVDLEVKPGSVMGVAGLNGAGKSTLLKSIAGVEGYASGAIVWNGLDMSGWNPGKTTRAGVVLVPENRLLFDDLTVLDNLLLGSYAAGGSSTNRLDIVFELFPDLKDRRQQLAGTLSGGEQQMVALGRGLMADPSLLLVDEVSLGLAPLLASELASRLKAMTSSEEITLVVVDQNTQLLRSVAGRIAVMVQGRLSEPIASGDFRDEALGLGQI